MSIRTKGKVIAGMPRTGVNLFDFKWADHRLDDMSWLRADTFSWHYGKIYKAAYNHLLEDCKVYAWQYMPESDGEIGYTSTETPQVGDEMILNSYACDIVEVGDGYIVAENYKTGVVRTYQRATSSDSTAFTAGVVETETVDDITITFFRAKDGHKICSASQEANVASLYNWMGIAWYYVLDEENKQFKLPRTKYAFTGLRDSVGGYVKAGLPNIEGKFSYYLANVGSLGVSIATGAFSGTSAQNLPTATKTGTETTTPNTQVDFKASRSSSVYGNSNTVQPEATQMYLYFYVGNFEREALEQAAGLNAEMFNNKADISKVQELENTIAELENKTRHVVVEYQAPSSSNKTTWFRIYSDGWVEQGGTVTGNWSIAAGAEQVPSVTLPIPVSNAHAFFSTRELYCLPMGYYFQNNSTIRARFGAYQVARTLTEFKYVVYGTRA